MGKPPRSEEEKRLRRALLRNEWLGRLTGRKYDEFPPYAHDREEWKCSVCGHEWPQTITNRMQGSGCPACSGKVVTAWNNLAARHPEIAAMWDHDKNGGVNPSEVSAQARGKFFFVCKNGHSYDRLVYQIVKNKGGCRYCAGQAATEDNNLAKMRPDIAKDWHPTKNGTKRPEDYLPGSNAKVWWQCGKGHEWRRPIDKRTLRGDRCPECWTKTSHAQLRVFAELRTIFSDARLEPSVVGMEVDIYLPSIGVGIELDGYPWHDRRLEADQRKTTRLRNANVQLLRIRDRKLPPIDDPQVNFHNLVTKEHIDGLLLLLLDLRKDKLGVIDSAIRDYIATEGYAAEDAYRKLCSEGRRVPKKKSLAYRFPEIARHWDYATNEPLLPTHVYAGANRTAHFICPDCGESYPARIDHRTVEGSGCSYCSGKRVRPEHSLGALHPELVRQMHPTLNKDIDPFTLTVKSNKQMSFVCSEGHVFETSANRRVSTFEKTGRYSGCLTCYRERGGR